MEKIKMFHRMQSLLLILFIIITLSGVLSINAEADTKIIFGEVTGYVGREVIVPVNIENNTGISAYRFRVSYDTSAFKLVGVEKGSLITEGTEMYKNDEDNEMVTFTWFTVNSDIVGDGEIARIKFKVLNEANGYYPLDVTYLEEDILNQNGEQVPCSVRSGEISILEGLSISGSIISAEELTEPVSLRMFKNGIEIYNIFSTDGKYSFDRVLSGTYIIKVSTAHYATKEYEIVVEDENIIKNLNIYKLGDLTENDIIDAKDVTNIRRIIAEGWNLEFDLNKSDLDGNNQANAKDTTKLRRYISEGWNIEL